MYLVIDKKTDKILWKNPAPLKQELKEKSVWHEFNSSKHKIISCDTMPKNPIVEGDTVRAMTLRERVDTGIEEIAEYQKIVDDKKVEKTVQEKVNDGIIDIKAVKARQKDAVRAKIRTDIMNAMIDAEFVNSKFETLSTQIDAAVTVEEIEKIK